MQNNSGGFIILYLQRSGVKNTFSRHMHAAFCIGVVEKGSRILSRGGTTTVIPENESFVINPGEAHTCGSEGKEGHDYRIIGVEKELMRSVASQISERSEEVSHFSKVLLSDKRIVSDIRRFFTLIDNPASLSERESVLISMLSGLILRHADNRPTPDNVGPRHRSVRRVIDYIEMNYAENLSLSQLAGIACLSRFHFQRVFLKNMGVSPNDYLVQLRIKKAREIMESGGSLADAALETGFSDQGHFTRFFKRVMGVPPGKYLRLNKGEIRRRDL